MKTETPNEVVPPSTGDRPLVFLELLLRAALALPLVLLATALLGALLSTAVAGPITGFIWIWQGDFGSGGLALAAAAVVALAFRALWGRMWEMPPSLL